MSHRNATSRAQSSRMTRTNWECYKICPLFPKTRIKWLFVLKHRQQESCLTKPYHTTYTTPKKIVDLKKSTLVGALQPDTHKKGGYLETHSQVLELVPPKKIRVDAQFRHLFYKRKNSQNNAVIHEFPGNKLGNKTTLPPPKHTTRAKYHSQTWSLRHSPR